MTVNELGKTLEDMYENAPEGEKVTMIFLFGIKYQVQIKEVGVRQVIDQSGISSTYATELAKAIKLGKYVIVK